MFLANANDTTVQVTIITTVGLIVVALIGVFTAKVTSGARRESVNSAESASKSAATAKDYAAALEAKDALLTAIEARLVFVEAQDQKCSERVADLERRLVEFESSKTKG